VWLWALEVSCCTRTKCGLKIAHFARSVCRCISHPFSYQSVRYFNCMVGITQFCMMPPRNSALCLWFLAAVPKNQKSLYHRCRSYFWVVMCSFFHHTIGLARFYATPKHDPILCLQFLAQEQKKRKLLYRRYWGYFCAVICDFSPHALPGAMWRSILIPIFSFDFVRKSMLPKIWEPFFSTPITLLVFLVCAGCTCNMPGHFNHLLGNSVLVLIGKTI